MPKRTPAQTITVVRDGKLHTPELHKPFHFTDEEVADVERLNRHAFAKTRTVDADEGDDDEIATDVKPAAAKPKAAAAKKTATEGL